MSPRETLDRLLDRHGQTFADEAGITLRDTPAPLLQLLVLTELLSANLEPALGVRAAGALLDAGLTTAQHLRDAGADGRRQVLTDARYLRTKQTAGYLGELAERVLGTYGGDLRRLRDEAGGDAAAIGRAVVQFTGIGAVGADIFCREVQAVWPSVRPFADEKVLATARALGLPGTAAGLAQLLGDDDLAVLGAALVRSGTADDAEELRA